MLALWRFSGVPTALSGVGRLGLKSGHEANGDNPAIIIQVGATYNDLGAATTGPQQASTSASKHT
ncbi:hypothetical protein [Bradyrhizobium sp.]|uniref:hypothetical protein n=1 Tax=Bradyrhizobium sp. TaxID=376 RepID=UPI003C45AAAE